MTLSRAANILEKKVGQRLRLSRAEQTFFFLSKPVTAASTGKAKERGHQSGLHALSLFPAMLSCLQRTTGQRVSQNHAISQQIPIRLGKRPLFLPSASCIPCKNIPWQTKRWPRLVVSAPVSAREVSLMSVIVTLWLSLRWLALVCVLLDESGGTIWANKKPPKFRYVM